MRFTTGRVVLITCCVRADENRARHGAAFPKPPHEDTNVCIVRPRRNFGITLSTSSSSVQNRAPIHLTAFAYSELDPRSTRASPAPAIYPDAEDSPWLPCQVCLYEIVKIVALRKRRRFLGWKSAWTTRCFFRGRSVHLSQLICLHSSSYLHRPRHRGSVERGGGRKQKW